MALRLLLSRWRGCRRYERQWHQRAGLGAGAVPPAGGMVGAVAGAAAVLLAFRPKNGWPDKPQVNRTAHQGTLAPVIIIVTVLVH